MCLKTTKDSLGALVKETVLHTQRIVAKSVLVVVLAGSVFGTAYSAQPYLDDANPTKATASGTGLPSLGQHDFPRTHILEVDPDVTPDELSKYQFIDAHASGFDKIRSAQNYSPQTMVLRHISARAYQGYAYKNCQITGGVAFESTGPVSQGGPSSKGCAIYAGHWLYHPGSPLTSGIDASTRTLRVQDASRFAVGQYVVIYDAPAGSFKNAEHAKVTARNTSTKTLTLQSRGFKSSPHSHGVGAIVAQHTLGQGSTPELWAWNMSTQAPKDGAGKTFAQFYADWLTANLTKYKGGADSGVNVAGILFDGDIYFELAPAQADSNNDLIRDDGMSPTGTNWLGDGFEQFYATLRARLPNKYIITGMHEARGFATTNGTQMENWLDYGSGDFNPKPKYEMLNSVFSIYLFNMAESRNIPLVHNLTKTPTKRYPGNANPPPPNNRPARLGLAVSLMDDGYYGINTAHTPEAWWDEYAVDVTSGSPTYGEAINMYSTAAIRQHRGWLGKPTGKFRRIYNDADFAVSKSKLSNGTFESSISGWTGTRVGVSRITNAFDGTGALHAGTMSSFTDILTGAQIKGPKVSLQSGKQYTVAFAARASKTREIKVTLGSLGERFMVGPDWRRYVMSFQQKANQSVPLLIGVGHENSTVDIDSVYVFEGNVNVFRRDFEHGIAIANATPTTRTISLGGTFKRIKGTQDPAVNNGATVTSVTLDPYDGLLLVRPTGSASTPPPPPSSGSGSGIIGNYVWADTDGDGIQDNGENGRGGVTVRLLECQGGVLQTTSSSSSGAYRFSGLAAGRYQLQFVLPGGTKFSPASRGSNRGQDSNPDPSDGMTNCVSMTATQTRNGIDAGVVADSGGNSGSGSAGIGDFVWTDADRDGIRDWREDGLGGVRVQLLSCESTSPLQNTTTNSSGDYHFTNLAPGSYRVRWIAPSGMTFSPQGRGGSRGKDSNADPNTGMSNCLALTNTQVRNGIDAGLRP